MSLNYQMSWILSLFSKFKGCSKSSANPLVCKHRWWERAERTNFIWVSTATHYDYLCPVHQKVLNGNKHFFGHACSCRTAFMRWTLLRGLGLDGDGTILGGQTLQRHCPLWLQDPWWEFKWYIGRGNCAVKLSFNDCNTWDAESQFNRLVHFAL